LFFTVLPPRVFENIGGWEAYKPVIKIFKRKMKNEMRLKKTTFTFSTGTQSYFDVNLGQIFYLFLAVWHAYLRSFFGKN